MDKFWCLTISVKRREAILASGSARPRRSAARGMGDAVQLKGELGARKSKENQEKILAFPLPNRGFSKGYGESK
jgi:hypothetical protein